jgi:3-methyl-2-oxobutanoate hydroxymethyltransferase
MTETSKNDSQPSTAGYLASRARIRISDLLEAKRRREKWAMLTSYDATSAKIFDAAKIPCILVGDSAAQAVLGQKSTLAITMDEMIPLVRAVATSCERALVIADLPFGSYQESPQVALRNATRFMKESLAHGVKLEGGEEYYEHVKLLTQSGIPVMAHVGFTPQYEHALSGFKVQGRAVSQKDKLVDSAKLLEEAGAFACVVELVPSDVGEALASHLSIPLIGIGAGPHTDAQVMVWTDMAGFTAPKSKTLGYLGDVGGSQSNDPSGASGNSALELNRVPKFVKRYANISEMLYKAALEYSDDVRSGKYPSAAHCYD